MAQRVVRAGVTSFLDIFSAETYVLPLRVRQREGGVDGTLTMEPG